MAKAKDLAGLAALGALGYYLGTRGEGDKKAAPAAATVAAAPDAEPNPMDVLTSGYDEEVRKGLYEKEPGWESKAAPAASAVRKKPVASVSDQGAARNPVRGQKNYGSEVVASNTEEGMRNYKPRYTPPVAPLRYQSLQDRARAYEDERAKSRVGMYGTAFKKGGAIKAKPPTASKRADGIASRGKTRGKIY